jgi:hypothetical protein
MILYLLSKSRAKEIFVAMNIIIAIILIFSNYILIGNFIKLPAVCGYFFAEEMCFQSDQNYSIYFGLVLFIISVLSMFIPFINISDPAVVFIEKLDLKDLILYILFIFLIIVSFTYNYLLNGYIFSISWLGEIFPQGLNNSISIVFFFLLISDFPFFIVKIINKLEAS